MKQARTKVSILRKYAVMLLVVTALVGCGQQTMEEREEEVYMSEKKIPTEEQLAILKESGLTASEIKEISVEGMSAATSSYVETAQIMLKHMEEKYGIPFMVSGGAVPDIHNDKYVFNAYALDGDVAFREFEMAYGADAEGNPVYLEGYFALLKELAVQEYLQQLAAEEGVEIKLFVKLRGMVGSEYDKDTELEDILSGKSSLILDVSGYMYSNVSDEEFDAQVAKLEQRLVGLGGWINYGVDRVVEDAKLDELHSLNDFTKVWPQFSPEEECWNRRYYKIIKP